MEHLSRALMNKFLHAPTVRLRAAAANGRGLGVVDTARYLFGLDGAADGHGVTPSAEHDEPGGSRDEAKIPIPDEPVRKA